MLIRPIVKADNDRVGYIIRSVMTAFQCVGEGYSIEDPEVNDMFQAYDKSGHAFFVIDNNGMVDGVGGIGPLHGAASTICELKKMYFLPNLRGIGMGKKLLQHCLDGARTMGYTQMYLETVERMSAANRLYQKFGFQLLDGPLGSTGHNGCDRHYLLDL